MTTHSDPRISRLREALRAERIADEKLEAARAKVAEAVKAAREESPAIPWTALAEASGVGDTRLRFIYGRATQSLPPSQQRRSTGRRESVLEADGSISVSKLASMTTTTRPTLTKQLMAGAYGPEGEAFYVHSSGSIRVLPATVQAVLERYGRPADE